MSVFFLLLISLLKSVITSSLSKMDVKSYAEKIQAMKLSDDDPKEATLSSNKATIEETPTQKREREREERKKKLAEELAAEEAALQAKMEARRKERAG